MSSSDSALLLACRHREEHQQGRGPRASSLRAHRGGLRQPLVHLPANPGLGIRTPGFPSLPPPHLYHQGPRSCSDEPRGDMRTVRD